MALKRKYVTFKAEDWDKWVSDYRPGNNPDLPAELPDCVIIRKQDVFAPNALYEYANQIRGACELAEKLLMKLAKTNATLGQIDFAAIFEPEIERLRELADDFFDEAMDSEEHYQKKVPD